ncbi:MAG: ABC transporter ATP-binding protein [Akkermansiaceae bacterium]|nr:ABC transporter ATP-binding protein [Akkermansiaceae bacterium]NNM28652.1 ABC transporter ATP-binding protein [Akkermansiaceae bacterium]
MPTTISPTKSSSVPGPVREAPMLEVDGLRKSFGGKPALQDVSFAVREGEIFGLLGHNGAGKSTALGIILGIVEPNAGEARIAGVSVQRNRRVALRHAGAIFESPAFYEYMSGWDNLKILMSYSGGFDAAAAREVVAEVGLADRIGSKVGAYSHGMRQRLALAQALLPTPKVLLLDEPTDGLDPEGIKWFRDFILKLRDDRGMTVLFNSHLLPEVEQMCDRVAIIRQGQLVYDGDLAGIAEERLVLRIDAEPLNQAQAVFRQFGGEEAGDGRVVFPEGTDAAAIAKALVEAGTALRELRPVRRSLEDVYLEVSGSPEPEGGRSQP